jgi:hypothetical protein
MRYGIVLLCVVLMGCAKAESGHRAAADSLTQRQRDSAVGASRLPGAAGVRGALRAQDSAAARAAQIDSIR